ncbi:uncharacterized protein LOC117505227 [Thalassophryne amazonica]|uniref:uncharacterized protein LOC117505227 n=1 Tax=Thalassophryne amazonica TaxID=390379 RepID=UPI0014710569|nr:uncharacterized protein LOC117505227 [Thalassophryne amazonica]
MSLQVCHCGWSKRTTYHGLRTHQGKMGCTSKGIRIPESQQLTFDNYLPKNSYIPVTLWPDVYNSINADMSLQVCHCGWSKLTTYHGLRTHQGIMGCTPKGIRIPGSQQLPDVYNSTKASSETPQHSFQASINSDKVRRTLDFSAGGQHKQICDFSEHPAAGPKVSSYELLLTNTQLLDCSSIFQKVEQTDWQLPTIMPQTTAPTYQKPEDDQELIKDTTRQNESRLTAENSNKGRKGG